MRKDPVEKHLDFVSRNKGTAAEDQVIRLEPLPGESRDVSTAVWGSPEKGSRASHRGDYRG